MAEAKASLNNYRQSPRKVRVVADLMRGKSVEDALVTLTFTTKRASGPLEKLLASAIANAKSLSLPLDKLVVKEIRVDSGATLKRRKSRSRGLANPIKKRTSHINIVLAEK
ncbi:50S ribosomal protein L22 [Candidatus Parcubacteria bacterium]|nr:50S ribosomal protein L22 [Candidatus Parcubacteria bacterium]